MEVKQSKLKEVKGKNIKIQIWDTTAQEAFQIITCIYYKGAIGVLLVNDITRHETFELIDRWLNEIKVNCSKDIYILIWNKKDLEEQRQVKYEEGEKLAKNNNLLKMYRKNLCRLPKKYLIKLKKPVWTQLHQEKMLKFQLMKMKMKRIFSKNNIISTMNF